MPLALVRAVMVAAMRAAVGARGRDDDQGEGQGQAEQQDAPVLHGVLLRWDARRGEGHVPDAVGTRPGGPVVMRGVAASRRRCTCRNGAASTLTQRGWHGRGRRCGSGCSGLTAAYQPVWSTQPSVRSTPLCQRAIPAARVASSIDGSQRRSARSIARSSSRSGPEADRQPRGVGGAQRARLGDRAARRPGRPRMSAWNCISSSLRIIPPSTRSSPRQRRAEVRDHRHLEVVDLVGGRLERGAGDVRPGRVARQPGDDAPGVAPPVRREQAGERGHEHDVAAVGHGPGERLDLRRVADDARGCRAASR